MRHPTAVHHCAGTGGLGPWSSHRRPSRRCCIALVFVVAGAVGLLATLLALTSRSYQRLSDACREGAAAGAVPPDQPPGAGAADEPALAGTPT